MAGTTAEDSLNVLLDELDSKAEQEHLCDRNRSFWVCQRRHPRHPFRASANIYFFPPTSETIGVLQGRTRNISRSGLAVVVKRLFRIGEPIEVEVAVPDRPRMHLGGLVTFCRYAGRGFHEIGITLNSAGAEPIFSRDAVGACERIEWLRAAKEAMQRGR